MGRKQKAEKDAQAQEIFNQICGSMEMQGYQKHNHFFSKLQVNLLAILLFIPLGGLMALVLYLTPRQVPDIEIGIVEFWLIFLPILIVSIIIHEYLHATGWAIFCKSKFKSVRVTFCSFTPMCACAEPLGKGAYIFGALLPFMVLGGGSLAAMAMVPNNYTYIAAFINLFLCSGDLLIVLRSLKLGQVKIIDHPTEPGFVAFSK